MAKGPLPMLSMLTSTDPSNDSDEDSPPGLESDDDLDPVVTYYDGESEQDDEDHVQQYDFKNAFERLMEKEESKENGENKRNKRENRRNEKEKQSSVKCIHFCYF